MARKRNRYEFWSSEGGVKNIKVLGFSIGRKNSEMDEIWIKDRPAGYPNYIEK